VSDSEPVDGNRSKWVPSGRRLNSSERLLVALLEEMNLEVVPSATNGQWEIDAYVPRFHMAVEVDGRQFHTRPEDSSHDRAKETSLRAEGVLVVRIWSEDLRDPQKRAKARKHIVTRLLAGRGIRVSAKRKRRILR
jgi:very-short-patch-repair endonuclease